MARRKNQSPKKDTGSRLENYFRQFSLGDKRLFEATATSVQKFQNLDPPKKLEEAIRIVSDAVIDAKARPDVLFALAVEESQSLLPGYATLDSIHRSQITNIIDEVTSYLQDPTRKRPLNALMLASPGAGKSHFIKQLAAKMGRERVQAVTFNMATMQSTDDMAQPIDELRNLKVNDRFPLLFLDEFDSDPSRYAALLPLLWDGELQVGHRDLKLGKAVIVLAGSNPDLPKVMDHSAAMKLDGDLGGDGAATGKLVDLLSRINGGIVEIPDLDLRTENRDRRVDKVCVTISLLRARFGNNLEEVPRALLRFVAHTKFRYGVRSIAHLIDIIRPKALNDKKLTIGESDLPMASEKAIRESSLRLHLLDKDQAFGIVSRWKEFCKDTKKVTLEVGLWRMIPLAYPSIVSRLVEANKSAQASEKPQIADKGPQASGKELHVADKGSHIVGGASNVSDKGSQSVDESTKM
jgi:RNA helicase